MFFKKVLVPYDESEHAKSALHIALGMVGDDPEASVTVVAVVSVGALPTPLFDGSAFEALDADAGAGAGIVWAVGILVVGLLVYGFLATGSGKGMMRKVGRNMHEMTGGLLGKKPDDSGDGGSA